MCSQFAMEFRARWLHQFTIGDMLGSKLRMLRHAITFCGSDGEPIRECWQTTPGVRYVLQYMGLNFAFWRRLTIAFAGTVYMSRD
jgi:hypothetical protein